MNNFQEEHGIILFSKKYQILAGILIQQELKHVLIMVLKFISLGKEQLNQLLNYWKRILCQLMLQYNIIIFQGRIVLKQQELQIFGNILKVLLQLSHRCFIIESQDIHLNLNQIMKNISIIKGEFQRKLKAQPWLVIPLQ